MADLTSLSDAELLALKRKQSSALAFKSPDVAEEFEGVDPSIKDDLSSFPIPLTITSGRRTPETNRAVGGVPDSAHLKGTGIDIRKSEASPEVQSRLKSMGYKVLDEGDHLHAQKDVTFQNSELPSISKLSDEELLSLAREKKRNSSPGITSADQSGLLDTVGTFFRKGTQAATAGLSEPVAAGISSLIQKGIDPEKTLGELYQKNRERQYKSLRRQEEQNPITSVAGDVAGLVAPGSAFGKLYKEANALVGAPAKTLTKRLLQTATRGGLANTAYQAINPDVESNIVKDFALGATGDLAGAGVAKAAEALPGVAKSVGSRFYDSLFKRNARTIADELASKEGQTLGMEMYDRGVRGKLKTLSKKADDALNAKGQELKDLIATQGNSTINNEFRIKELQNLRSQLEGVPSLEGKLAEIDDKIAELVNAGGEVRPSFQTLGEGQRAKQNIYRRDMASYEKDINPIAKELDLAEARALKKGIEEPFLGADGVNPVRDMNQELGFQSRLKDALEKKAAQVQGSSPLPKGISVTEPLDIIRKLLGLDTVFGASNAAQGLKTSADLLGGAANTLNPLIRTSPIH